MADSQCTGICPPQGHLHGAITLAHHACYLHARFTRLGAPSDLDEGIPIVFRSLGMQESLNLCSQLELSDPSQTVFYYSRLGQKRS